MSNVTSIVGMSREHDVALNGIESIEVLGQSVVKIAKELKNHEDRIANLEDTMRVNGVQEYALTSAVNKNVVSVLGGKEAGAYKNRSVRSKVYSAINKEFKRKFGVPRRAETPAKEFDAAIRFIENWIPDIELKQIIQEAN